MTLIRHGSDFGGPKADMPDQSARSRAFPALLIVAGVCLTAAGSGSATAPQTPALGAGPVAAGPARGVLDTYAVTCHNSRLKTAGLQLDSLDIGDVAAHAEQWEKVVTKLRTGEMPPPGRPRPDAATYQATVAMLERQLD